MLVGYAAPPQSRRTCRPRCKAVHVVVGSSGLTADDYAELDRLARDRGVGVVAAANFSIMAAILKRAAALAAQHLHHWEIIDYASADKPDVPSGTSRELAEALAEVRIPRSAVPLSQLAGRSRHAAPKVAGTGSTRCCGCPTSW